MKPRVFISSTYYDLKHVRERIEKFIENYYFESVLFESDHVTFEHNKPLDTSCYNEVKQCHMMILIIGGRYGSAVTEEDKQKKKDDYNEHYVSITRKEYETALNMNIPVFIFIEKNVYAEYETYSKNKDLLEKNNNNGFAYAHVDDVNVFRFINFIKGKAIKTFEKVEDIENYLGNQFAGMMFIYLQQLKDLSKGDVILYSVNELQRVTKQMNEMLQAVGKNIIEEDSMGEVILNQDKIEIEFFINDFFFNNFVLTNKRININQHKATVIYESIEETIFNKENYTFENHKSPPESDEMSKNLDTLLISLLNIDKNLDCPSVKYGSIITYYFQNIYPRISARNKAHTFFKEKFISRIKYQLSINNTV